MAAFDPYNARCYTDNELIRYYDAMCQTARQRRMDPAPWQYFVTRESRVLACLNLHHALEGIMSPGLRRLRNDPRAEDIRQATLADNVAARQLAESTMNDETNTTVSAESADTRPAGKRRATKAKSVKAAGKGKGKAKKAPKAGKAKKVKAPAKKRAANAPRTSANDDKVIKVKAKENPRRAGTVQFERFAQIMKFNGKTEGAFKKSGGDSTALNRARKEGHVSA